MPSTGSPDPRPNRHTRRLRHAVRLTAATGVAATLAAGSTLQASADPGNTRTPDASAKRAGVSAKGGGYAGWATRSQSGQPGPQTKSAQPKAKNIPGIHGIDVAAYQGNVNWKKWWKKKTRFAYIKATEGSSYRNKYFTKQYNGSAKAGMTRGAYHFARPDASGGAKQANHFAAHGGGWSADGKTLPGMLDIEDNYTSGGKCYGKTPSQLVSWTKSFIKQYRAKTSRNPVIYTNKKFWKQCLNNSTAFHTTSPLSIASWGSTKPTALPGGWSYYTFWQYSGTGTDRDTFSGSKASLKKLATG